MAVLNNVMLLIKPKAIYLWPKPAVFKHLEMYVLMYT